MYCYRVWYDDGSAILVDAACELDAIAEAIASLPEDDDRDAERVECLAPQPAEEGVQHE